MGHPDFNKPFILCTDASKEEISAVLLQSDPSGQERPIAYASKIMNQAQKSYSTPQKECLALVYGVKIFHHYLICNQFTVETDHYALSYLQKAKGRDSMLAHWAVGLSEYNFTVRYRAGKNIGHADGLSRLPISENEGDQHAR